MNSIITRFPPSPTGYFHIGSARTALFNYLYAKKNNGQMLFRFEDTDKERSKPEFEEDIKSSMEWLGISYDGEVVKQSDRTDIYKDYLNKMIEAGAAYISKEESKKEAGQEVEVIRFKNPNKKIKFVDLVRGDIEFDTTELGDFVIARNIDEPLYHLSVVIDDFLMGVNHVIRGEDHISNTPRQILIQEAIGAPRPAYAHIPLILAPDRSKMSKRHGAVSLNEYKRMGYLPEAIINYLALLGWNPGTDQEIFTMDELIEKFDLLKVQKGGAIFNTEKLDWINKEHLRKKPWNLVEAEILSRLNLDDNIGKRLAPTIFERINKYGDIDSLIKEGEIAYFQDAPHVSKDEVVWKKSTSPASSTGEYLADIIKILEDIPENSFDIESIKEKIGSYAEEKGRGDVLWPMRYSLSGKDRSPDPYTLTYILGKEESIKRLRAAQDLF